MHISTFNLISIKKDPKLKRCLDQDCNTFNLNSGSDNSQIALQIGYEGKFSSNIVIFLIALT